LIVKSQKLLEKKRQTLKLDYQLLIMNFWVQDKKTITY